MVVWGPINLSCFLLSDTFLNIDISLRGIKTQGEKKIIEIIVVSQRFREDYI